MRVAASRWASVFRVVGAVGVLFALVTLRVVFAGEAEIAAGTQALRDGKSHEALACSARAAEWYVPGAPHVAVAYGRLIRLAEVAEGHRKTDLALAAWRNVRTAARSTRWLLTPHAKDLARADREIARLMAANSTGLESASVIEKRHLQELMRDEAPRVPWVVALLLGLATFSGGLFVAAKRMARSFGEMDWRAGRTPLLMALFGMAVWLLALWRA